MNLHPQDVLVMLKLAVSAEPRWTYESMAQALGMSQSMAYNAVRRAGQARLYDATGRRPRRKALEEFLMHGVKYAFPPDIIGITRGVPTSWASPALQGHVLQGEEEVHVWPHPEGNQRGIGISPLYRSVPEIARRDGALYEALSLVDAIRIGRARLRELAQGLLTRMLGRAGR